MPLFILAVTFYPFNTFPFHILALAGNQQQDQRRNSQDFHLLEREFFNNIFLWLCISVKYELNPLLRFDERDLNECELLW
jgi:hypothetical protein